MQLLLSQQLAPPQPPWPLTVEKLWRLRQQYWDDSLRLIRGRDHPPLASSPVFDRHSANLDNQYSNLNRPFDRHPDLNRPFDHCFHLHHPHLNLATSLQPKSHGKLYNHETTCPSKRERDHNLNITLPHKTSPPTKRRERQPWCITSPSSSSTLGIIAKEKPPHDHPKATTTKAPLTIQGRPLLHHVYPKGYTTKKKNHRSPHHVPLAQVEIPGYCQYELQRPPSSQPSGLRFSPSQDLKKEVTIPHTETNSRVVKELLKKSFQSYIHQLNSRLDYGVSDEDLKVPKAPSHVSAGSLYHYHPLDLGKRNLKDWLRKHRYGKSKKCSNNVAFGRSVTPRPLRRFLVTPHDASKGKDKENATGTMKRCIEGKLNARREVLKAIHDYHINSQARLQLEKRANEFLKEKKQRQQKKIMQEKRRRQVE